MPLKALFLVFNSLYFSQKLKRNVNIKSLCHVISEMNGKSSSDSGPTAEDDKQSNPRPSETRHRRGGAAAAKQRYKKGKS